MTFVLVVLVAVLAVSVVAQGQHIRQLHAQLDDAELKVDVLHQSSDRLVDQLDTADRAVLRLREIVRGQATIVRRHLAKPPKRFVPGGAG